MNNKMPPELAPLFGPQLKENYNYLSLSANENVMSHTAAQFLGSNLANRYYFKTNNSRYMDYPDFVASGYQKVDEVVEAAKNALCQMSGASYVNLSALSGIHAMIMVIVSLTEPGDTILSLPAEEGGHFSTRPIVEKLGRKSVPMPLSKGRVNIERLAALLKKQTVKLIYLDLMSHIETVDIAAIRRVAEKNTRIVYDASHTLGLILGGQFQDPFAEGADVICANTHKTFPGPHRGVIMAKSSKLGEEIENIIGGIFYSSVHYCTLLAMLVTIFEMQRYGRDYAAKIISNASSLAKYLELNGVQIAHCSNKTYTKNHQIHLTFQGRDQAISALRLLRDNNIVAHMCYRESIGHFVRLGTQEVTRLGMAEDDMESIARIIASALEKKDVKSAVQKLVAGKKDIHYSFDNRGATL